MKLEWNFPATGVSVNKGSNINHWIFISCLAQKGHKLTPIKVIDESFFA